MNTPRPSAQSSDFGLLAWLENTRIALPLKGVECRFQITGAIACVELDQFYHQNTDRPLDCTYTFPLPAGAAVYRCELHVNGRVIRAKVEAQEDAQRIFREQKAAGHRAALVESVRENLFTLSLGNVQPEDVIVVRMAWFQVLDRAGDGLRLFVPTCPGVRYIPGKPLLRALSGRGTADDTDQVPDASRISPPRIDALHPDAAYFSIEGRLSPADVESGTASSPSHPIFVRESEGAVTVALSHRGAVPDCDFVLAWREPKARQLAPQSWHWPEGNETFALVQLRAPDDVEVAGDFPQDFYFLIDRSGSMQGAKWQRTCEALRAFVGLLGAEDRVWITLFESDYRDFSETPMAASAVLADRGFQRMETLGTAGGTELLGAALHVLEQLEIHSAGGRANVVLITDGQVGNDSLIVHAFARAPHVRVHTFGIDTTVNDAFLKALAGQHRGRCWLQTPDDDIAGTVAALGARLRRPVLTDLSVRGAWEAGSEIWPDLHAEEVVAVSLRGDAATPLEITGRLPDGREHSFVVDLGVTGSEAVRLLWAKERIATLLATNRRPEAIALARQHNLICEGAAFVAWDEVEQVQIAVEELVQPAMQPSYEKQRPCYAMQPSRGMQMSRPMRRSSHDSLGAPMCSEWAGDRVGSINERVSLHESAPRAIPELLAELRLVLESAGVPEPALERMLQWVQTDRSEIMERCKMLGEAVRLLRSMLHTPAFKDILGDTVRRVLSGSAEALLKWSEESRAPFHELSKWRDDLTARQTPPEVIDRLTAWVLESGTFDDARVGILKEFAEGLDGLPFSASSEARCWRALLTSTVGEDFEGSTDAARWLSEMNGVEQMPPARRSKMSSAHPQFTQP